MADILVAKNFGQDPARWDAYHDMAETWSGAHANVTTGSQGEGVAIATPSAAYTGDRITMKDFATGDRLPVTIQMSSTLIRHTTGVANANNVGEVNAVFSGKTDLGNDALELRTTNHDMFVQFAGLRTDRRYRITASHDRNEAVDGSYKNRWTKARPTDAVSFLETHTPGTDCARTVGGYGKLRTGLNDCGAVLRWTSIVPDQYGRVTIECLWADELATDDAGEGPGTKGYGLTMWRLEELSGGASSVEANHRRLSLGLGLGL